MAETTRTFNPDPYLHALASELVGTLERFRYSGAIAIVGLGKRLREHLRKRAEQCTVTETTKTMFARLNSRLDELGYEGSWRDSPKDWETGGIIYFVRPSGGTSQQVATSFPLFDVSSSETKDVKLSNPTAVVRISPFENEIKLDTEPASLSDLLELNGLNHNLL